MTQALMSLTPTAILAVTTTAATTGNGFAIPQSTNKLGRVLTWQIITVGPPDALNVVIQIAMNDTDTEYATADTSTIVGGEMRTLSVVNARFVRAKQVSRTAGTSVTVQIMIQ